MCGKEVVSPKDMKIEGAVLRLCQGCSRFGIEIGNTKTKSTGAKYQIKPRRDANKQAVIRKPKRSMYSQMKEVDLEFHEKIRQGREERGLSQVELAKSLNERASLIKKLERGDVLPTEKVRKKLEKYLKINLLEDVE
tara:strand:+ start:296 stop:706 length:411 start_codon:yes stop_codon:yes gene_type:complete